MPIQVSDSLRDIIDAQESPALFQSFYEPPGTRPYFRPLRDVQIKALLDLSSGHYHLAYRGFHVALFLLAMVLFARATQVRTATDAVAAASALTVFLGLHTFPGTVASAYPFNHFLEVVVLVLLAFDLTQGQTSLPRSVALVATFLVASLTLETGILVWVVVCAAFWSGAPGVSRRAILVLTACVAGYLVYRVSSGYTTRAADAAGFLLERLEPSELAQRFGDRPLVFYAYNVAASIGSVLFAEPRSGVFIAVRDGLEGSLTPRVIVALLSSIGTTAVIAFAAWRRRGRLFSGADGQLLAVFLAVLAANAVLSYGYTKDEIMSVAGAFYALAAYAAVRQLLAATTVMSRAASGLVAALLLATATGWAVRTEGLHYALYIQTFKHRNDWVAPEGLSSGSPSSRALTAALRAEILSARPNPNPRLLPVWTADWFEEVP